MLVGVCLRLSLTGSPLPHWELSPTHFVVPETGLTPAMSVAIDALVALGSGLVVAAAHARRRAALKMHAWVAACAGLVAACATAHALLIPPYEATDDTIRGSIPNATNAFAILSALCALIAMSFAARRPPLRTIAVAAVVGFGGVLAAKAWSQAFFELPAVAATLDAEAEEILRAQGVEPGTPQANLLLRKLSRPDVTGWIGLANPFGVVLSALLALALGVVGGSLAAARDRLLPPRVVAIAALVVPALMVAIVLTRSTAAVALAGAGVAVFALVSLRPGIGRTLADRPGLTIAIPALAALGALAVRPFFGTGGALGGERSLLFRSQYASGAIDMAAAHPITGVGPGSFQTAYGLHKPALSPEAAADAHSVVLHLLATLGLPGLGAVGIAAVLIAAHCRKRRDGGGSAFAAVPGRAAGVVLGGVIAAVVLVHAVVRWPELTAGPGPAAVFGAGVLVWAAFGAVAVVSLPRLGRGERRWGELGLVLASATVIAHAQVDVTATLASTALFVAVVVGLALPMPSGPTAVTAQPKVRGPRVVRLAGVVVALAIGVFAVLPAARWEGWLGEAAGVLRPMGQAAEAARAGENGDRGDAGMPVRDPVTLLTAAAEKLERASAASVSRRAEREALLLRRDALEVAAAARDAAAVAGLAESLAAAADRHASRWGRSSTSLTSAADAFLLIARVEGEMAAGAGVVGREVVGGAAGRAVDLAERAVSRAPRDLPPRLILLAACREAGRPGAVRRAARGVLEVNAGLALDPAVQLPPEAVAALERLAGE